jgi:hypothetical protein
VLSVVAGGYVARHSILRNAVSRRMVYALALSCLAMLANRFCAFLLGGNLAQMLAADLLILSISSAIGAVVVDRRLRYVPVWFLGCALLIAVFPEWMIRIVSFSVFGGVGLAAYGWRHGDPG